MGKYYIVDLESMKEVERFTDEVIKDVAPKGGIDYLILSAGGPPLGVWRPGPDVPLPTPTELTFGGRDLKRRLRCSVYHG
jgi:hypothetical protein